MTKYQLTVSVTDFKGRNCLFASTGIHNDMKSCYKEMSTKLITEIDNTYYGIEDMSDEEKSIISQLLVCDNDNVETLLEKFIEGHLQTASFNVITHDD